MPFVQDEDQEKVKRCWKINQILIHEHENPFLAAELQGKQDRI